VRFDHHTSLQCYIFFETIEYIFFKYLVPRKKNSKSATRLCMYACINNSKFQLKYKTKNWDEQSQTNKVEKKPNVKTTY